MGLIWAAIMQGSGLIGSYRGLQCATGNWHNGVTGLGFVIIVGLFCGATLLAYGATFLYITGMDARVTASANSAVASRLPIIYQGIRVAAMSLLMWLPWCISGFMLYAGSPASIGFEMFAGLLINMQPCVSYFTISKVLPRPKTRASIAQNPKHSKKSKKSATVIIPT